MFRYLGFLCFLLMAGSVQAQTDDMRVNPGGGATLIPFRFQPIGTSFRSSDASVTVASLHATTEAGDSQATVSRDMKDDGGNFLVLGMGYGSPSSLTFIGGLYFDPVVVRVSGGGWGKGWYGIQGDIGINLSRGAPFVQDISVIAGRFGAKVRGLEENNNQIEQFNTQSYVGLAYDVYYAGFFLQFGLGFGKGDFPNPQLAYQVGYLFAF